jgi:RNA polymerase sigma factor (sigma-70 family)
MGDDPPGEDDMGPTAAAAMDERAIGADGSAPVSDSPPSGTPSLERLARRAASGDDEAFEGLVRRCYERIHRWALVVTGDPDEADDVTQDTLLRLRTTLPQYRGEARFGTWLYRVTRSVALDRERRRSRRARKRDRLGESGGGPARPTVPDPVERIEAKRLAARVGAFLGELPLRQREALDLVDLQGYTPSEAAEMLGMKAVTVRAHLFRARKAIRGRLLRAEPTANRTAADRSAADRSVVDRGPAGRRRGRPSQEDRSRRPSQEEP